MSQRTYCGGCGTIFYTSNIFANKCNICQQTEAIEKQGRLAREQMENHRREQAYAAENNARIVAQAEYARAEAIREQTIVLSEAAITSNEAYNYGYNYVDTNTGNEANLHIEVTERGGLSWTWNHVYHTERLRDQFRKGINDRLNRVPTSNTYDTMKASAQQIGKLNAEGTMSSYFTLYTGVVIAGKSIPSVAANTHFKSVLDEQTGELKMTWDKPFTNDELNDAYLAGVNEVHWKVNTTEMKQHRLITDVLELRVERMIGKSKKRLNRLFKVLIFLFPFLGLYTVFHSTGWFALLLLIGIWPARKYLKKKHGQWQDTNNNYLQM